MNQTNTTKTYIPGIYIESKPVVNTNKFPVKYTKFKNSNHLLLVYRDKDGNERVIRGGPEDDNLLNPSLLMFR